MRNFNGWLKFMNTIDGHKHILIKYFNKHLRNCKMTSAKELMKYPNTINDRSNLLS